MKSEEEIKALYYQLLQLKNELENLKDPVSVEVAKQADKMLAVFEWVLDKEEK